MCVCLFLFFSPEMRESKILLLDYCIFFWISCFSSSSLKCFNEGSPNKLHGYSFTKIANENIGKYERHCPNLLLGHIISKLSPAFHPV